MASNHDKLIHCDACGEDYSATYRRCPFCGERNDPKRSAPPAPSRDEDDQDDGYVFDGQDAFDDEPDDEYYTPRPKAGKRLAPKQGGRGMDLPPVNWPRLITFLCSLVIIVAALIIVFTVIYPQLHGNSKDPNADVSQSQPPASPDAQPSGLVTVTSPPVESDPVPPETTTPAQVTLTGITLYGSDGRRAEDFTLWVGQSYQLAPKFAPEEWSGQVTYESSNPNWVSVSATGLVTNVNASGKYHNVYITVTAEGVSAQCVVRAQSRKYNEQPTQSTPPEASDPPVTVTTPPSGGNNGPIVGRTATVVNAELGLRVRSGPGTSYETISSLVNGSSVNVLAAAEGGWYQVSFPGGGGTTIVGYVLGEYLSGN